MNKFDFGLLIPIVAIAFSLSIPIVAIIVDYLTKKSKIRLMEKAIEKGVAIENLSLDDVKRPRVPYRSGMVLLATGIGLSIFAVLMGRGIAGAMMPIIGAGALLLLIGIALIVNDKLNYDRLFNKEDDQESSRSGMV